jgi:hypothetical protein
MRGGILGRLGIVGLRSSKPTLKLMSWANIFTPPIDTKNIINKNFFIRSISKLSETIGCKISNIRSLNQKNDNEKVDKKLTTRKQLHINDLQGG